VTSGGTAGTEIVALPDATPALLGLPHIIIFQTQTDPGDVLQVYGKTDNSNPVYGTAFGPIANFDTEVPNTSITLTDAGANAQFNWNIDSWNFIGQSFNGVAAVFPASTPGQLSLMVQKADGTYGYELPSALPGVNFFTTSETVTTGAAPVSINPAVYRTDVISGGTGGDEVLIVPFPAGDSDAANGLPHLIRFLTQTNGADNIVIKSTDAANSNPIMGNAFGGVQPSESAGSAGLLRAATCHLPAANDLITLVYAYIGWQVTWSSRVSIISWNPVITAASANLYQLSDGSFGLGQIIGKKATANNADTTISIPSGYQILALAMEETANHAVTGGVKIGTTSGGTEVVAAQAVGALSLTGVADAALLKKLFSFSGATTLFIQAVGSWNSAVVNLQFILAKVNQV
jgi:hypothetical protein